MGSRRHLPEESHLRRRGPVRDPKIEIWVYCEGKRTEPAYLTAFRNDHATHLVRVETVPVADVPLTLVNRAVEKKLELERAARRSKDSFAKAFAVWGMFDVDHDRDRAIPQACDKAKASGVHLAISNPCFELWGILHYCYQDGFIKSHDLCRRLATVMPGYDPTHRKEFNYHHMRGNYAVARSRALLGRKRREEEDDPGGNPSTGVIELLDLIIANGRKGPASAD